MEHLQKNPTMARFIKKTRTDCWQDEYCVKHGSTPKYGTFLMYFCTVAFLKYFLIEKQVLVATNAAASIKGDASPPKPPFKNGEKRNKSNSRYVKKKGRERKDYHYSVVGRDHLGERRRRRSKPGARFIRFRNNTLLKYPGLIGKYRTLHKLEFVFFY